MTLIDTGARDLGVLRRIRRPSGTEPALDRRVVHPGTRRPGTAAELVTRTARLRHLGGGIVGAPSPGPSGHERTRGRP